jgi:hypothetical protein
LFLSTVSTISAHSQAPQLTILLLVFLLLNTVPAIYIITELQINRLREVPADPAPQIRIGRPDATSARMYQSYLFPLLSTITFPPPPIFKPRLH